MHRNTPPPLPIQEKKRNKTNPKNRTGASCAYLSELIALKHQKSKTAKHQNHHLMTKIWKAKTQTETDLEGKITNENSREESNLTN
jgi:hypothetical protein